MDTAFNRSTDVFHDSSATIHSSFDHQPDSRCTLETSSLQHDVEYHSNPSLHPYPTPSIQNLLHGALPAAHTHLSRDHQHTTATTLTHPHRSYEPPAAHQMQYLPPVALPAPSALPPATALADECIYVYVIIALHESVPDSVWNRFQSSLFITQPVTEEQMKQCNAPNSFACFQQLVQIASHNCKSIREISARIFINNYLHHTQQRFLFQIFLQLAPPDCAMASPSAHLPPPWDKLDVVTFIQLPSTGQILRPIGRELLYEDALCSSADGMFLGSFTIHDTQLYHQVPSEDTLKAQEEGQYNGLVPPALDVMQQQVSIVDREHIVQEANGARAGRPSHRLTGQLLMTRSQVEKILEIRARWHGLSPRQRRDNVAASDFYTFFTLNRDETAECLGVCATWLKDAIRAHGVNVWPGRPLRRSGAALQTLKENIASMRAALKFSHPSVGETERMLEEVKENERKVEQVLKVRMGIVKANVSEQYYSAFLMANGEQYLNPEWNALPPFSL